MSGQAPPTVATTNGSRHGDQGDFSDRDRRQAPARLLAERGASVVVADLQLPVRARHRAGGQEDAELGSRADIDRRLGVSVRARLATLGSALQTAAHVLLEALTKRGGRGTGSQTISAFRPPPTVVKYLTLVKHFAGGRARLIVRRSADGSYRFWMDHREELCTTKMSSLLARHGAMGRRNRNVGPRPLRLTALSPSRSGPLSP